MNNSKELGNKTGIITDFDNVLVKTSDFIFRHLEKTCERLKRTPPDRQKVITALKTNARFEELFNMLFGQDGPEVLGAYREDAMLTPYEASKGAVEFVKELRRKMIPIVIVSNRINKLEDRLLQAGFEVGDFAAILQAEPAKPDKQAYNGAIEFLKNLDIDRPNFVVTGDHPDDYLACPAEIAGQFTAVLTGLSTRAEFVNLGVATDMIFESLTQLGNHLQVDGRI